MRRCEFIGIWAKLGMSTNELSVRLRIPEETVREYERGEAEIPGEIEAGMHRLVREDYSHSTEIAERLARECAMDTLLIYRTMPTRPPAEPDEYAWSELRLAMPAANKEEREAFRKAYRNQIEAGIPPAEPKSLGFFPWIPFPVGRVR